MKEHLYEHVYQDLLRRIQNGQYAYGDYLPTENQLCEEYDVSIITVRTALEKLKESNLITKVKGKGSMVIAHIRPSASANKSVIMLKIPFPFQLLAQYPEKTFPAECFSNNNNWGSTIFGSMCQNMPSDFSALLVLYEYDTILNAYETTILQSADRIVILGYYDKKLVDFLHEKGKLVVLYNYSDQTIDASCVNTNDRGAFQKACDYLYSLGHTSIAAINGNVSVHDNRERAMGYQDSVLRNGTIVARYIKWGEMTFESGYFLTNELLDTVPELTAILCVNDNVAMGALYAIQERGLRCPEDISLIGHDNNQFVNEKIPDFLSTIDPHFELVGKKFAEMLTRNLWIEESTVFESELVLRKSVAPPRTKQL